MGDHLSDNWTLSEEKFVPGHVRRYESAFCQGNGYLGMRASPEEQYEKTDRCLLIAGIFDRMERKNTSELARAADLFAMEIKADGERLSLNEENHTGYRRTLDLRNGFLTRSFQWTGTGGVRLNCNFERFVSMADKHLLGQRARFGAAGKSTVLDVISGIGGKRRGEPHFLPGKGEILPGGCQGNQGSGGILQYAETTHESGICVSEGAVLRAWIADSSGSRAGGTAANGAEPASADVPKELPPAEVIRNEEGIFFRYRVRLAPGQELILEKLCRVASTRDRENGGLFEDSRIEPGQRDAQVRLWQQREQDRIIALSGQSYHKTAAASAGCWEKLWREQDVRIETRGAGWPESSRDADSVSEPGRDQLAVRFAIYHMNIMAPLHDSRMGIGAKGLSGPGYCGHSFWDTEIYLLPFFIWTNPSGARSLLEYRFHGLDSARRNAKLHGFEGAMYPWESGWITDGEVCPDETFSKYEQHVTADIAYGIVLYEAVTGDREFMAGCGCELLFETARFWSSRLEYCREKDRYEIHGVIGPDEFTHDADNNAFTNYMACLNLTAAVRWHEWLKKENPAAFNRLNAEFRGREQDRDAFPDAPVTDKWAAEWKEKARKLYLPAAGRDHVLPQDDTWLTLPEIDLTVYRSGLRRLRQDYPYPSYSKLKVAKQADAAVLLRLLGEYFPYEVKKASYDYYEPLCVHESSLSLSAYALLAADIGEKKEAYELFSRGREIDMGTVSDSGDAGIHAASLGGIWQCCVLGFGGLGVCGGRLRIYPALPDSWERLSFQVLWQGRRLEVFMDHDRVQVQAPEGMELEILTRQGTVRGTGRVSFSCGGTQDEGGTGKKI